MKRNIFLFLLITLAITSCKNKEVGAPEKPNFLIFFIDDLRPELGCYGENQILSPNIDAIANKGLRFERAYCNVPVCGASRASLLTGRRPTPQRFIGYDTWADKDLPGHTSLPGYFKENGYYTLSYGKIFHHRTDSKESWSEEAWHAPSAVKGVWRDYITEENNEGREAGNIEGPAWEKAVDAPDSAYIDGKTAMAAVRKLKELSSKDQPFMFWVGFVKPHLPFNAPSKYWDLYDPEKIELASNPEKPENAPKEAMHNFGELRSYSDIPATGPLSDEKARQLIHGYYACVSYTDALIGQVMEALKELDLDKNTVVAVFGDHGWNLGEHGLWCKHCNFNTSLHVPLIVNVPWITDGTSTEGLTEYVDLFPTFAELAGLDIPDYTDGKSLVPLLENPELNWQEPVYPRYIKGNSVVTTQYIYTEFMNNRQDCTIVSNMLYDHYTDPDENLDISDLPDYIPLSDSLSVLMNRVHMGR